MSINEIASGAGATTATQAPFSLKTLWIGAGIVLGFAFLVRLYEQLFGFSDGLDSFSPEFQLYWRNLLLVARVIGIEGKVVLA
jgi:methane/ammonia monooxygenase subunit C